MTDFDLHGPLPTGTTVLEASAGTGKTYTIAALTARYVAEGTPLDRILLVTFGRLAAGELRARVRERLTSVARDLADPSSASKDEVSSLLASGSAEEVARRRARLLEALASFDAATIATTHTFAATMLRGLGMAADVDPAATLTDDSVELVTQAVTDLFVQAFAPVAEPPFSFAVAREVALAASDASARLAPENAQQGTESARRVGLANVVRREVATRKRRLRIQGFDDILTGLRDALLDPVGGEAARERLRARFDVVMVDEFQDTDPIQWDLLEAAFHGHRTLVLIGDPKQAIYAFRGGDVFTYLRATEAASLKQTLATNWRSDASLLGALDELMGGVALGDQRIRVLPVQAHHETKRLTGAPVGASLRLRVVSADQVKRNAKDDLMRVDNVRRYIAMDAARDIVRLLSAASEVDSQPLQPGDVAVLVSTNLEGVMVREELARLGVPVVLAAATSVFTSPAARDWLTLLRAMEQPHRRQLVRSAALTCFVGWSAGELARADEAALDAHASRLRSWADLWRERGCAALLEAVSPDMTPRVLGENGGERVLTDVRHVGQILDAAQQAEVLGPAALIQWLRERLAEATTDGDEERSRRLDSDADAVQVVTIHRSKGLEFPVVYAPFLWNRFTEPLPELLLFHDRDGVRVRDVGGRDDPQYTAGLERHLAEDLDESLRLAYVALTRAQSQVVVWWAPTTGTESAPLHRLLFGVPVDGEIPLRVGVPSDENAASRLEVRFQGDVSVEEAHLAAPDRWASAPVDGGRLAVRQFPRVLDSTWARTSYSSLTADLHDLGGTELGMDRSDLDVTGKADEPGPTDPAVAAVLPDEPSLLSPMRELPVGAAFGTLVHSVYEKLDFTSADLRGALVERCEAEASGVLAEVEPSVLAEALLPSLLTPLGPLAGGLRLADFPSRDVLAEMEYEYPMAGGDARDGRSFATVDQIADLLETHLRADDPLLPYAADLRSDALRGRPLRGFVGGFLDVILRVRDAAGTPRYLVVDYKTNWLGPSQAAMPDGLTSARYSRAAMAAAMRESHYPLQALLYSVALHRFLRWRQPDYDPGVHLGGALYLFVRGMCGPETPLYDGVPAGVFSWDIPASLVVALSDLVDRGKP